MTLKTIACILGIASLFASNLIGASDGAFAPVLSDVPNLIQADHQCPVSYSREPLRYYNGEVIQEGHHLILDVDSYPRAEGRLVSPPAIEKTEGGWMISFALDKPDDVEVRIVARDGAVVRRLGCGVLGANAPEPFRKDILTQEIFWNGCDADDQPAADGWRAEVRVGLRPKFEQFIGYDRTSVVPQIIALEVDPQGRLYVATSAQVRSDPTIVRFDRDGEYLDMVYPPDPSQLAGQKIEALYRCGEYLEGRPMPTRARSWTQYFYQWPVGVMLPFRMDNQGNGFVAEILSGWGSADTDLKTPYRVFPTGSSDSFWFLQNVTMLQSSGAFTLDGKGGAYLAARTFDLSKGSSAFDWEGVGRIRKINLATGQPDAVFTWNGDEELPQPSEFLGAAWPKPEKVRVDRKMPAAPTAENQDVDSSSRFVDIKDMAIDGRGRLLVVDSRPRRIKVFEPNGWCAGVLDRIEIEGVEKSFSDIRSLRVIENDIYLLASLDKGPLSLIKCHGNVLTPAFVWHQALDQAAQYLAVDVGGAQPIIWCGNGKGPGTITRIVDEGARGGQPKHFGGTKPGTFPFPCSIAADDEGRLFVYDLIRKKIIRTNDQLTEWQEMDAPLLTPTLYVDRVGKRLLVTTTSQVKAYGLDLAPIKELTFKSNTDAVWSTRSGGAFGGVDRDGNLYACDGLSEKEAKGQKLSGQIRRYGPDGVLRDQALAQLTFPSGSLALDSHGNIYALDLAYAEQWTQVSHNLPVGLGRDGVGAARLMFRRGEHPVWQQSDLCYLVKFGPDGGVRNTESELWSHRGFSPHSAGGCKCDWPRGVLAIDAADRIFGADAIHHHVKVLDTAGNLIMRPGWWGNAQTVPADGDAREFGFWNIYSLTAAGDTLYVCDKDLRRIAQFRMDYREVMSAAIN